MHELPAGVLWGSDGATEDQCGALLALLEEFRDQVGLLRETGQHEALVTVCELHFRAYRDYLRAGSPAPSYEAYLRGRAPTP